MAEAKQEPTEKAPRARRQRDESAEAEVRGSYGVFDEAGQVLIIESSKIRALEAGEPYRARVQFWPYGATREQVVEALNARMPAVRS